MRPSSSKKDAGYASKKRVSANFRNRQYLFTKSHLNKMRDNLLSCIQAHSLQGQPISHSLRTSSVCAPGLAGGRWILPGVFEKRGAGAGWVTPS